MPEEISTLDNDSSNGNPRRACACRKRVWKRRHFFTISLIVGLHYIPLMRSVNFWRGARDERIFPLKNIKGRLLASGAYVRQGNEAGPISPAEFGVENFQPIQIPIKGRLNFHQGYFLPQSNSPEVPTLVWFHNTDQNVGSLIPSLCDVYKKLGVNIVSVDMRGFGSCDGTPTGKTMADDARRIIKFVADKLGSETDTESAQIDQNKIFVFGHGLASNAALEIVSHPETRDIVQGAILSNPLPTILDSLQAQETIAPAYWLRASYPDRFDNSKLIKNCNRKLLILGNSDGLDPTVNTLNDLVENAKFAPHHVALIGGMGTTNSFEKLEDMPKAFLQLVDQFFNQALPKTSGGYSSFQTPNFTAEHFEDFHQNNNCTALGVCSNIGSKIQDRIAQWNDYLHEKIDNENDPDKEGINDPASGKPSSFANKVRNMFA